MKKWKKWATVLGIITLIIVAVIIGIGLVVSKPY
jgi:uncharacterized membrane-anchored protein